MRHSPAEETPLPVILKVRRNDEEEIEELHCQVQPGWTEGVFRIMLDPRYPRLPRVIIESGYLLQKYSTVSVCAAPQGHLYLEAGQPITLTFSVWDELEYGSVTLDAGILEDFTIPDHA